MIKSSESPLIGQVICTNEIYRWMKRFAYLNLFLSISKPIVSQICDKTAVNVPSTQPISNIRDNCFACLMRSS